jgi:hypothetical protein
MVQPYEPRVDAEGETGVIFIGGTFSHAVHKGPTIRRGAGPRQDLLDNLVTAAATPTTAQLRVAGQALAAAEELLGATGCARVDMVETTNGGPPILELELLDPVLFFPHHPEGAVTLARELAGLVERR